MFPINRYNLEDEIEREQVPKNISKMDKHAPHKNPKRCPACTAKLDKNGKGTKYRNGCSACRATLAQELKCRYCNTHRVWRGSKGKVCHGCGQKQR